MMWALKSREFALVLLGSVIGLVVVTELFIQHTWREDFPNSLLDDLEDFSRRSHLPDITIIELSEIDEHRAIEGFESEWRTSPGTPEWSEAQAVNSACCSKDARHCAQALTDFHDKVNTSARFWFIHSNVPDCFTQSVDNVGFSSSTSPPFLSHWRKPSPKSFSGPFENLYPLNILRLLFVEGLEGKRLSMDSESMVDRFLCPFLDTLHSLGVEIQLETSSVQGADVSRIKSALGVPDLYKRSHDLHSELSAWTTSAHVLAYPAHALPPLFYLATVIKETTGGVGTNSYAKNVVPADLYEIEDFGAIIMSGWENPSMLVCAESVCTVTEKGLVFMSELVIKTVRNWLGLESSERHSVQYVRPFSATESIQLKQRVHRMHLSTALNRLKQLQQLIANQPNIAVTSQVVQKVQRSVHAATIDGNPALAALLALESLNDPSLVARPFFSTEFTFALYAPLGLPIGLPIVSGLVKILKNRRRRKAD